MKKGLVLFASAGLLILSGCSNNPSLTEIVEKANVCYEYSLHPIYTSKGSGPITDVWCVAELQEDYNHKADLNEILLQSKSCINKGGEPKYVYDTFCVNKTNMYGDEICSYQGAPQVVSNVACLPPSKK